MLRALPLSVIVLALLTIPAVAADNLVPMPTNVEVYCDTIPYGDYEEVEIYFACSAGETLHSISYYMAVDSGEFYIYDVQPGDFWDPKAQYFYVWGSPLTFEQWATKGRGATSGVLATFKIACEFPCDPNESDLDFGIIWAHDYENNDISATVSDGHAECIE